MFQTVFVNTEQEPLRKEHICFYTKDHGNEIELFEIQKIFYKHPDAPEYAEIMVIQENSRGILKRSSFAAASLVLLEASQNNTRKVIKNE